jgi:hypothetical protein
MAQYLYSNDTSPANAAQISADSGEIVHVECVDASSAHAYARRLRVLLAESNTSGDLPAELETVGTLDGAPVRVHCSIP